MVIQTTFTSYSRDVTHRSMDTLSIDFVMGALHVVHL